MLAAVPQRRAAEWLAWDPVGHAFGLFACAVPRQPVYAWYNRADRRPWPSAVLIRRAGWWLFPREDVDLHVVGELVRAGGAPHSLTVPRWLAPVAARVWAHVPASDSSLLVCTADTFMPSEDHLTLPVTPELFLRLGMGRTAFPGVLGPDAAAECRVPFYAALADGAAAAVAQGSVATRQVRAIEQVITRPDLRGRGYGRSVVSRLTAHILAEGKLPIYQVEDGNAPSRRLAEALGFWHHTRFTTFYFD